METEITIKDTKKESIKQENNEEQTSNLIQNEL